MKSAAMGHVKQRFVFCAANSLIQQLTLLDASGRYLLKSERILSRYQTYRDGRTEALHTMPKRVPAPTPVLQRCFPSDI